MPTIEKLLSSDWKERLLGRNAAETKEVKGEVPSVPPRCSVPPSGACMSLCSPINRRGGVSAASCFVEICRFLPKILITQNWALMIKPCSDGTEGFLNTPLTTAPTRGGDAAPQAPNFASSLCRNPGEPGRERAPAARHDQPAVHAAGSAPDSPLRAEEHGCNAL